MCGITGIISNNSIQLNYLIRMNQVIRHRGPDDEGYVLFNDQDFKILGSNETSSLVWSHNCVYSPSELIETSNFNSFIAFGHRRLSIIDTSPKGHQPMSCRNNRFWITYNGEIYNYLEIKSELIELGFKFETNTDTEVIIASYIQWGENCQRKLNGMWSFAIYDRLSKTIFLSRDRFGIKPLYYWFDPYGTFYFASEIKQFTVLPGWKAKLNPQRALDYLYNSLTDHTDETLFDSVFSILPGHCILQSTKDITQNNSNKITAKKWYIPSNKVFKGTYEQAKSIFLDEFEKSIELQLRADVQIGSSLSGGIDSSSIVSFVNHLQNKHNISNILKTFSSCSSDIRFSEKRWIDEVIKEKNIDPYIIYPDANYLFLESEKLIWQMDEPYQSQSAFLSKLVYSAAKDKNIKVLLCGQGADEYLSGYGQVRFLYLKKLFLKFNIIKLFRELNSLNEFIFIFYSFIRNNFSAKFVNFILKYHYLFKYKYILQNKFTNEYVYPFSNKKNYDKSFFEGSCHQLLRDPLPRYLRWEDRNSMSNSIEARVPFLDHNLVEFTQSLPIEFLYSTNRTKRILVDSLSRILPEKIRNRTDKKGFITPEEMWFKEEFRNEFLQLFDSYIVHAKGLIDYSQARKYILQVQDSKKPFNYTYWRLIAFCIWIKVFDVEI
jgi:asparagine synthase (glutamine-hydrolysing)